MKKKSGKINTFDKYINFDKNTNSTTLPVLYNKKENCCGCTACYAACPVKAIQMLPDSEGFLYPVIDAYKCIRCHQCLTVCMFKIDQKKKGYLE